MRDCGTISLTIRSCSTSGIPACVGTEGEGGPMIKSICLAVVSLPSLVGCQGNGASSSSSPGDPFASGGGPAPQTVSISAQNGTTYTGQAGISASVMPDGRSLVLLMIIATDSS